MSPDATPPRLLLLASITGTEALPVTLGNLIESRYAHLLHNRHNAERMMRINEASESHCSVLRHHVMVVMSRYLLLGFTFFSKSANGTKHKEHDTK